MRIVFLFKFSPIRRITEILSPTFNENIFCGQTPAILISDGAYACDPRMLRMKEKEKQKRLDAKLSRIEAARRRAEERDAVRISISALIMLYSFFEVHVRPIILFAISRCSN